MKVMWIIEITCLVGLWSYITAAEAIPIGPLHVLDTGSSLTSRQNKLQRAEFGEGIKDWFTNVRNRIFGGGSSQAPPLEAGRMMMELENEHVEERKRKQPAGFFLDISNLSFNPDRDWGFRLGQWYFIRKANDAPTTEVWKPLEPNFPDWPSDVGKVDDMIPPMTPNFNGGTTMTIATTDKESRESTESAGDTPKVEDNETFRRQEDTQSAEVLLPSE